MGHNMAQNDNDSEEDKLDNKPNLKTRKQWSVTHEPKSILKRLRSQLAEDGCPESQYLMAKTLLECEDVADYEENCHQAIFWLLQSSIQGSQLATEKLEECLRNGTGICEQNYEDVIKCLKMDLQEKLSRVAAKQLFYCLSEGNDFVSLRKLKCHISEIIDPSNASIGKNIDQHNVKNLKKSSLEHTFGSERLSEAAINEAAKSFIQGKVPLISIDHHPSRHKYLPWNSMENVDLFCLNLLYRPLNKLLSNPLLLLCFLLIASFIFYTSIPNIVLVGSLNLDLFALFLMLYSVTAVLKQQINVRIFNMWSAVFKSYSPDLNVEKARSKFDWVSIQFYFIFFLSLFIYLCLLPFTPDMFLIIVFPLLAFVSVLLFFSILRTNSVFNLLISSLWVFSHCPEGQSLLRQTAVSYFPISEDYLQYQGSVNLGSVFCIHVNMSSALHCLWLTGLLFASRSLGLKGILHHALCISWIHMILISNGGLDWVHYTFGFWAVALLLPFVWQVISCLFPSTIFSISAFTLGCDGPTSATIFVTTLIILFVINSKICSLVSRLLKWFVIFVSCVALFQQHIEASTGTSSLKWEQYQAVCLSAKESPSMLSVRACSPLTETVIQWQAIVKQVEIESITNWVQDIVSLFPQPIKSKLECTLGEHTASACDREIFQTDSELEQCLAVQYLTNSRCSLQNWNVYAFNIIVSMESNFWKFRKTTDVILQGSDRFQSIVFKLLPNDRISFIGNLRENFKQSSTEVSLLALSCADCKETSKDIDTRISFDINAFHKSLKTSFNFFLGPTLMAL